MGDSGFLVWDCYRCQILDPGFIATLSESVAMPQDDPSLREGLVVALGECLFAVAPNLIDENIDKGSNNKNAEERLSKNNDKCSSHTMP